MPGPWRILQICKKEIEAYRVLPREDWHQWRGVHEQLFGNMTHMSDNEPLGDQVWPETGNGKTRLIYRLTIQDKNVEGWGYWFFYGYNGREYVGLYWAPDLNINGMSSEEEQAILEKVIERLSAANPKME